MHAGRLVARARDVVDVRARVQVRLRVTSALAAQFEHAIAQAAERLQGDATDFFAAQSSLAKLVT